jgi:hypothetical protein
MNPCDTSLKVLITSESFSRQSDDLRLKSGSADGRLWTATFPRHIDEEVLNYYRLIPVFFMLHENK